MTILPTTTHITAKGGGVTSDSEEIGAEGPTDSDHEHHRHPHAADGKYVYEVAGVTIFAESPMSQEDIEMEEWLITGKMTPAAEEYLKNRQKEERFDGQVIQRVVDPDGKLHHVIVPEDSKYEEGDAISRSELGVVEFLKSSSPRTTSTIGINGTEYDLPEAYYAIEDRYERAQYLMKFGQSKALGISMAEADRMVAAGEMDLSLSVDHKRRIDKQAEADARHAMFGTQIILPPVSDKPPVKVRFLRDEGQDALPGWLQKQVRSPSSGSSAPVDGVAPGTDNADASGAPVGSDAPVSPSGLPDIVKPIFPPSAADIETQLTPQGFENELTGGLSADPADKAQQLIDRYGTAEGLRRLRESDPDAAERFERDTSRRGRGAPPRSNGSSEQQGGHRLMVMRLMHRKG